MSQDSDQNKYDSLGDRVEAAAELVGDHPEMADWYNNYQGTLAIAGIEAASLSDDAKFALRRIAASPDTFIQGVWDLVQATRDAAYNEGLIAGLTGHRLR